MKKIIRRIPFLLVLTLSLVFLSCDSWMSGNNFFDTIAEEVKYANAEKITVFIRYPNRQMGETSPNGKSEQKVDIPFSITAVDANDYGFYKWAAFSTSDFNTIRQYSDVIFIDEESYEKSLAEKELGEDEVVFEDPRSAVTVAKVLHNRNDVFIMPICVQRPYIQNTIPAAGSVRNVKNISINIVFSNPMDSSYLIDEHGNLNEDYVCIQTAQGAGEKWQYKDIDKYLIVEGTQYYLKASLSTSKKTLIIDLPETSPGAKDIYLPPMKINVAISHEVKDILGYELANDVEFSFDACDELDSISPKVMELEVGGKTLLKNTSDDLEIPRIGKYLNIRAWVGDQTKDGEQPTETNVNRVNYRLERIQDPNSTLSKTNTSPYYIMTGDVSYAPGVDFTEDPVPAELTEDQSSTGVTFPINMTNYNDGLWKLTLWATDNTGNVGKNPFDQTNYGAATLCVDGAPQSESMYVYFVKDTQSPANTNSSSITAQTEEAPYGWYNPTTLSNIKMKESTAGAIVDSPNYNNAYKSKYVWWAFHMGDGADSWASSITPNSTAWHKINAVANPNGESLSSLLGLSSINASSVPEGTVNLSVMFKDDVGNMSSVSTLDAVKYDGTKPVAGALTWITPDGVPEGFAHEPKLTDQTLKIPFTETLSGIKKISITVEPPAGNAGFTECREAFNATGFNAKIQTSATAYSDLSFGTQMNNGVQELVFVTPLLSSSTNTMQNYIYLDNLKIGYGEDDEAAAVVEGIYTVKVKLYDSALNVADEKTVEVFVDKTKPVVTKLLVENAVKYGSGTSAKYYLTSDAYSTGFVPDKVTLDVTMVEKTSGIYEITLGENASVIAPDQNSGIVGTRVLDSSGQPVSAAYTVDESTNTIRFTSKSTAPKSESPFTLKLTNVKLAQQTVDTAGDMISVTVKDFATLGSNTLNKINFSDDDTPHDYIYMDYNNRNSTTPYAFKVKSNDSLEWGYANSGTVNALVVLPYNIDKPGINRLKFVGVKAVAGTTIELCTSENDTDGTTLGYSSENGGLTIKLNNPLIASNQYHYLKIEGMELVDSTTQGSRTISVYNQYLTGWEDSSKTKDCTLYFDDVAPAVNGELSWVATSSSVTPGIAKTAVISDQYLVIPVTEATSGVNNFKIEVKKEGGTNLSAANSCASVDYVGFDTSDTISTGGSALVYPSETPVPLWGKDTNKITVVYPTSYGKYKHYYIKGLTISGANPVDEGNYIVSVTMYDQAGNVSTTKTITISNDHTCPVVEDTWFEGVENTALNGSGSYEHPHHRTYTTSSDNNTLYIKMTETGSGIKTINLQHYTSYDPYSGHNRCRTVIPTSDTKLYVISETNGETHTEEVTGFTYSATSSFRGITLPQTKAIKGSHVLIKITGLKITEGNTTTDNELKDYCAAAVRVVLTDYATNTSTYPSSPAGVTTNNPYAAVVEDNGPATIMSNYGSLSDSGKVISEGNLVADSSSIAPGTGFTNSPVVNLSCKLNEFAYDAEMTSSSGLRVIKLEGASFIPDSAKDGTKGTCIYWVEYCHSPGKHANFNGITPSGNRDGEKTYKVMYYIESKDSIADCGFGFTDDDLGFYLVGNDTLVFRTPLNVWDNYYFYLYNIKLNDTESAGEKNVTIKVFDTASQLATTCPNGSTATYSIKYSVAKPTIKVKATDGDPEAITAADIQKLVPKTNGLQAYADGTKAWVYNWPDSTIARKGTVTGPAGAGVYKAYDKTPYFNLDITPSDSTVPLYKYAWTFDNPDVPTSGWSGTTDNKVNVSFPVNSALNQSSTGLEIYLHVSDYAGNVTTKKMGNFKWINEGNANVYPVYKNSSITPTQLTNSPCYLEYPNASSWLRITLPASAKGTAQKIYIPESYFNTVTNGSPIYGYALVSDVYTSASASSSAAYGDIAKAKRDENGPYLEIPASNSDGSFSGFTASADTQFHGYDAYFFVYDATGAFATLNVNFKIDQEKPALEVGVLRDEYQSGTSSGMLTKWKGSTYVNSTKTRFNVESDGTRHIRQTANSTQEATTKGSSETDPIVLYASKNNPEIMLWTNSMDVIKFTCTVNGSTTDLGIDNKVTDSLSTNYLTIPTISAGDNGTLYKFSSVDKGSNEGVIYIQAYLDDEGPSITLSDVKNVNQFEETVNGSPVKTNYFGANATAKVTVTDSQAGLAEVNGTPCTTYSDVETNLYSSHMSYNPTSESLTLSAKDLFNNQSSESLSYNGGTRWIQDTTAPGTPSLLHDGSNSFSTTNSIQTSYNIYGSDGLLVSSSGSEVTVLFVGGVSKITVKPNPNASDNDVMGYVSLSTTSTPETFYAKTEVTDTFEYTVSESSNITRYIYAVDKAGNCSSTPLTLMLKPNDQIPSLQSIISSSGFYSEGSSGWFSKDAKINVEVNNSPTQYAIGYGHSTYGTDYKVFSYNSQISIPEAFKNIEMPCLWIAFDHGGWSTDYYIKATNGTVTTVSGTQNTVTSWKLDDSKPTGLAVNTVTPTNGTYKASGTQIFYNGSTSDLTITPTASDGDNGSGIKGYSTSLNFSSAGTEPISITAPSSSTSVTIYAFDNVGNSNNQTITLTKDVAPPTVTIKEGSTTGCFPIGSTLFFKDNTATLKLEIKDGDGGSGIKEGSNLLKDGETITLSDYLTADNKLVIPIDRVMDNVGNTQAYELISSIVQDSVAPNPPGSVSYVEATDGNAVVSGNTVYFNGDTTAVTLTLYGQSDTGSGVAGFVVTGATASPVTGSESTKIEISTTGLGNSNTITIQAKDGVGNTSTEALTVTLKKDTQAPKVTLTKPAGVVVVDGKTYFKGTPNVTLNITDPLTSSSPDATDGSGVDTSSGHYKNGDPIPLGSSSSGNYTYANNTLTIASGKIQDKVGNTQAYTFENLVKDETGPSTPTVSIAVAGDGAQKHQNGNTVYYNDATTGITITPSATDTDGCGVAGYSTSSAGTNQQSTFVYGSANGTTIPASVTIYAVDKLGNVSETGLTLTLTKDDVAPTVEVQSVTGDYTYKDETNHIIYFKDKGTSDSDKVKAKLKITETGSGLKSGTWETGHEVVLSGTNALDADGKIVIGSNVVDNVGNAPDSTTVNYGYKFVKDSGRPSKPGSVGTASTSSTGGQVYLSGTTVYYNSSTKSIKLTLSGASDTGGSGVKEYYLSGSPTDVTIESSDATTITIKPNPETGDFPASVKIKTKDRVGNTSEDALTVTLTKDVTAPTFTQPSAGTPVTVAKAANGFNVNDYESGAKLTFTITEAGSGLAAYAIVYNENEYTYSGDISWNAATGNSIEVTLPTGLTHYNTDLMLFLKDNVGNVTKANDSGSYEASAGVKIKRNSNDDGWWFCEPQTKSFGAKSKKTDGKLEVELTGVNFAVSKIEVTATGITGLSDNKIQFKHSDGNYKDVSCNYNAGTGTITISDKYLSYDGTIKFTLTGGDDLDLVTAVKLNGSVTASTVGNLSFFAGYRKFNLITDTTETKPQRPDPVVQKLTRNITVGDLFTAITSIPDYEEIERPVSFNIGKNMGIVEESKIKPQSVTVPQETGYNNEADEAQELPLQNHAWKAPDGPILEEEGLEGQNLALNMVPDSDVSVQLFTATDEGGVKDEQKQGLDPALILAILSLCGLGLAAVFIRKRTV